MMTRYKQLLTYIKSAVTRNHSEKSINSILDYISTSKNVCIYYRTMHDLLTVLVHFHVYLILVDGVTPELLRNYFRRSERRKK